MVGCHNTPSTGTPPTTAPFNRSASLQEQVARALQANFLLLHQPAPNAFIVLDPSPVNACQWDTSTAAPPATGKRHRFRVTLGGHSPGCTCSEQPLICPASTRSPCAHTLFVLLRVLRLKLEDPRIARPRLENYEVEPLLQRYARLRASNFRASGASRHQDSTTTSAGTATNPAARIFMPRPVVLSAVGPNPCLLAAVRASVGSSECSELSSITRSIEPASRGVAGHADAIPVCRRCLSHASSSSCGGDGGGGGVGGGGGCGAAERAEGSEGDDSCGGTFRFDRRPKTEPQAYYETLGSRIEMLNSTSARHALSTTFRPIGEPSSNPETDPETEGVSSSSRSSRFEEAQGGVVRGTSVGPCGTASSAADDTLTGLPRRSASPDGMESSVYHPVCRLCLRELARVAEGSTTVCASVDCVASFHQACFLIWQDECETETGSLYCPVCGRVWTTALTPTNPPDDARKLQAPRCAEDAHCVASSWAPGVAIVSTRLAPSNGDNIFLHSHVIPGLKDSLDDWKSAFSEEVAMGIISPYWHVRQSALRQVAKITICRVLMARRSPSITFHQSEGSTPNKLGPESLRMSFRLIQYFLSDPADEVFIASLCAFREILGYLICLDTETMTALQRAIGPVLRRLLIFVGGYLVPGYVPINNVANEDPPAPPNPPTDGSMTQHQPIESAPPDQHRRANLALATLVELAKGQDGEMSIGRDTSNAGECMSISGLPHLAHFLLRSAKFHQTHLVGRLKLLEKLVEMHRDAVSTGVVGANKRISYRHLCSSLIFTRRHVYPPEQPVFPHNYVSEEAMAVCFGAGGLRRAPSSALPVQTPLKVVPQHTEVQLSSSGCLMEANIKASRLARRVFIVVARALLQEPRSVSPGNGTTSLPHAESFVNAEIALLDVSLAARLRAKLSDFLVIRAAAAAEVVASPAAVSTKHEPPPIPPPRRFSQSKPTPSESRKVSVKSDTVTAAAAAATNTTQIITPSGIRVALEPAYDHVALSETAPYSSGDDDDDEEDVEEEPLEKLDWEEVGAAQQVKREAPAVASPPPPRLPVVPTPAELSALKTALRTAASSSIPLVSIPNLAQSLDAKEPLKTEYRYREGVDWLLGPFLGKGAFSQCYQARDLRTGTLMAVKRLRFMGDSSAESMEQLATATEEVAIMRRLHHPNVLRLFGIAYNPEKRHVDIFVEWMPGGSITSLLNQYGAFTEPVSLAYILQVIRGISCLHKHGILHRDLKGANLLVDGTGSVVRISDFGASARLGTQGSVAGQFQGQVIGTFAFMAPEVLRGETYGRACDIWSVGCCLLEMLSGKPPWNDSRLTNQYALMFTIASADQPPSYPKSISPPVKKFLDSCFNRIPEQRPTARRLLQHPVFSSIVSAPEPPTTVSPEAAGLSKSFTTVGLCSTTRAASRHRALPPVPNEPPRSPPSGYDKLAFNVASGQQNANKQPRQHQVVTQRKICRNQ